jgi:hypothetical protein
MADSNQIELIKNEFEEAIKKSVELFKHYKEISKEFQKQQKIIRNNSDFESFLKNKINKIVERRKGILKRKQSGKLSEADKKLSNLLNSELANEEKMLRSDEYKDKYRNEYNKLSEIYLVNSDKKFLKEKEKIRKMKKIILKKIKVALSQLKKKMFVPEFKEFIKYIHNESYDTVNGKELTFKKLMNYLESGEISEEAAKKTKQINELETINNIDYRKSEIEYEINKLKKNKKKNLLYKKLIEIKENIKKIFKKNFKGTKIPEDLSIIIKILEQQKSLSKEDKEKVKLFKKQIKSIKSKMNKFS